MSLDPRYVEAVQYLYPNANFGAGGNVRLTDSLDGQGSRLAFWGLGGTPPTNQQITDALAAIPAALVTSQKTAAKAILDVVTPDGRINRAILQEILLQLNTLRALFATFKTETAAATTFANFQTRMAGLTATPPLTKVAEIAAIKTAVDGDA